jgi:sulfur carrier protein
VITVNGTSEELPRDATLHEVLERRGAARDGVAVAVDGEVMPRRLWRETALRDGSSVEVLTAVQGG